MLDDKTLYECPICEAYLYNAEYGESDSDISEGGLICEEDDCDFEVQPDELEDFCTNVSTQYNNII